MFNKRNGTLYTGVTSNLIKRVYEHKNKVVKSFTSQYGVDKLGYYEVYLNKDSVLTKIKYKNFIFGKLYFLHHFLIALSETPCSFPIH